MERRESNGATKASAQLLYVKVQDRIGQAERGADAVAFEFAKISESM
jgi:hypothetical protein